jgi:hypothetical protein
MKERRNSSKCASALPVALSTGLISISAILFAGAPTFREKTPPRDAYRLREDTDPDSVTSLGNYPDTSMPLSTDTTVSPDVMPTNTTRINASTSTSFQGTLTGDPLTGVVRVTDARPAGTYTVTVRAFNAGNLTATKMFTLTVTTPATCSPVSFAPPNSFAVGNIPRAVAIGDFNRDGKQDLAVANGSFSGGGHVSILWGDGSGSFGAPIDFIVGIYPVSVAVGDFNGDGKQDLAVANYNSGNVSILLGDGVGYFGLPNNFTAGTGPASVAVGDFNGDGKQDLAVANNASNNVSILLGNGTGNFSPATNFPVGEGYPYSLAVGDFNADGKQDLALANDASGNVSILLGDGGGNFSAPLNFGSGPGCDSVALGDFNGDGKQDLAMANHGPPPPMGGPGYVSVLFGDGTANFSGSAIIGYGVGHPVSIAVGDFNGDGKQDLAVNMYLGLVSLFLGDGAGNFSGPTNFGVEIGQKTAVGDFNGDGEQDLAVANVSSNSVSILMRICATPTPSPTPTPRPPVSISGTVTYCSNPALPPLADVLLTLTGSPSGSTTSDASGNYSFTGLTNGNNYTATPTKPGLTPGGPGSAGINTLDVVAIQRHFLQIGTPLSGCRLTAADCAPPIGVNTVDVLATQAFFLQLGGFANVGHYQFLPLSRSYLPLTNNQTAQNYSAIVLGDVVAPFTPP